MARLWKNLLALFLLPVCVGTTRALWEVLEASGSADSVWVPILAGAACWWVLFVMLPRPMWVYVFGHELTHALWTWAFGGKVKRFRASSKGGFVEVTKSNCFIDLAPYFFPVYVVLLSVVYAIGNLAWGWEEALVWFHFLGGAAFCFHLTFTWHVLQRVQSDIVRQGYFFSAVLIWLGNVIVMVVAISLLTTQVSLLTAMSWCWIETGKVFLRIGVGNL